MIFKLHYSVNELPIVGRIFESKISDDTGTGISDLKTEIKRLRNSELKFLVDILSNYTEFLVLEIAYCLALKLSFCNLNNEQ